MSNSPTLTIISLWHEVVLTRPATGARPASSFTLTGTAARDVSIQHAKLCAPPYQPHDAALYLWGVIAGLEHCMTLHKAAPESYLRSTTGEEVAT